MSEMTDISFLKRDGKPELAYMHYLGISSLPTVMFLGGFRSDMMGTKAEFLFQKCIERKQSFIRFDYSGHGMSGGKFEEGCISDWKSDAIDILEHCAQGPVILIGSSMGGWIALLIALERSKDVQALIGLAAAPDFTSWMEKDINDEQRMQMKTEGHFELPNEYDDTPYTISQRLIEDGRNNLLLNKKNNIDVPVRLIQGKKDSDVPWKTAEKIRDSIINKNVEITYLDDADHRLSGPDELIILNKTLKSLI